MAVEIVASSQITLVDLNDAKSLSSYITTTQPKIQIYNPNNGSYTPDWSVLATNVVLTPELYVTGTVTDIIAEAKSITWYENGTLLNPASLPAGYAIGAANPKALTISQNKLSTSNTIAYTCEIVWTDTTFGADIPVKVEIEFAKVQSGQKGDSGIDALTAVVSNEAHTVPADLNGNVTSYAGSGTTISLYEGATALTYDGIGTSNGTWKIVAAGTSITPGAVTDSGTFATVAVHSAMTADTATINYTITGKRGDGTAISLVKTQTITKAKTGATGATGASAISYWLTVGSDIIAKSISNIYSPTTVTINAFSKTGTNAEAAMNPYRLVIEESIDGGTTWRTAHTDADKTAAFVYTPTAQATAAINLARIRLYATSAKTAILDEQLITILSDGNAITATLSNDVQTIPTLQDGTGGVYTSVSTIMSVYSGATDDSNNWTYTLGATAGVTAAFASVTAGTVGARTVNVTAMTIDSGIVTITATKSGFPSQVKVFSVAKNKQGIASTAYWVVSSAAALQQNLAGTFTPANIVITPKMQTGSNAVQTYTGRIMVEEYKAGAWQTATYNADASTYTYTPSASTVTQVRIGLYIAGGTATLLDQEIIPVVKDGATGATGANSVIAYVWAPNGNIVKNGAGSVTAKCDVYNGVTPVTASVYKWYKLVAGSYVLLNATTNYGTTGYTTATLTIPASAVESMSSFKCTATYNSSDFSDVVTVVDQSDPIQTTLIAAEGTVFRNGQGTKNITAKVYQGGAEIDVAGTTYEYRWYLRDQAGVLSTDVTFVDTGKDYKTGKTIAVLPSQVTNIGNLTLELWTLV